MNHKAVFLLFSIPILGVAARPSPEAAYCALLDPVADLAASQSPTNSVALDVLERVALGRTAEISVESEAQVGRTQKQLRDPAFSWPEVRACALRKIGETGLAEAVDFLRDLKRADVGTDITQEIWVASRVALRDALLRRIEDPQLQIEFLENTLMEPEMSRAATGHWAVDQLCDRGSLGSLVVIQEAIRKRRNGQRDDDEIAFCEARIRVLYGKPDRVKALASVLNLDKAGENPRLTSWTIEQLALMHLREAHAELDRFANEIAKMPVASPGRERFLRFREDIRISPRASER
jgi:hypothetical protein